MPTKELKSFSNMPSIGHMYLSNKHCFNSSNVRHSRRKCTGRNNKTGLHLRFRIRINTTCKHDVRQGTFLRKTTFAEVGFPPHP